MMLQRPLAPLHNENPNPDPLPVDGVPACPFKAQHSDVHGGLLETYVGHNMTLICFPTMYNAEFEIM